MKRALIAVLALAVALPLAAQEGPLAHRAKEQIINFLDLVPEQVEAWDGLLAEREAAADVLHQIMADVQAQLDDLFAMEEPEPTAVGVLVLQRRNLGEELAEVHQVYVEGFVELLDEEQMQSFAFIHHAERAQPLFPAFRLFGFLPPR